MASLTVRGIPDELLERMRRSAELRGRSLNSEATAAFERQVGFAFPDQDVVVAMIRARRDATNDFILPRPAER